MESMENDVVIGTELKLNLNIPPTGGVSASKYNFELDFYCTPSKVKKIQKEEVISVDDDNFIVCLNTKDVGKGLLKCKVTAHVPDEDFADGIRTEIIIVQTNINIIKDV